MTNKVDGEPKPKKPRRKLGPNGIIHWLPTRARDRDAMREFIRGAIAEIAGFPTRAAVIKAGEHSFSPSSVDRHIDLVDEAQAEFNRALVAAGGVPHPTRKGRERTARQDRLLEEERARSADLAGQVKVLQAKVVEKDERIAELEERLSRLEAAEVARRRERRSPLKRAMAANAGEAAAR